MYNKDMDKNLIKNTPKEVTIRQEVRFGKPTVNNTRVTIADILHLLKAGYTVQDIPEQYPGVTSTATIAAIDYAAQILGQEEILSISN